MSEPDSRPTSAEFAHMPYLHRRQHVKPLKEDGDHFTAADINALRAARVERLKGVIPRKVVMPGAKNHTIQSQGIRRNSGAA